MSFSFVSYTCRLYRWDISECVHMPYPVIWCHFLFCGLMNSVFYFVEPAGTTIPVRPHGGAREKSIPNQHQPHTSLDPETNWPPLSTGISNQGIHRKEMNISLDCVGTGNHVSKPGECTHVCFICTV